MSGGSASLKRRRGIATLVDALLAFAVLPVAPVIITTRLEGNWWDWMLPWGMGFHLLHTLLGCLIWRKTLGKKLTRIAVVNRPRRDLRVVSSNAVLILVATASRSVSTAVATYESPHEARLDVHALVAEAAAAEPTIGRRPRDYHYATRWNRCDRMPLLCMGFHCCTRCWSCRYEERR